MPSPPTTGPLAVDLDVLKLGTTEDPVSRDDVERALYALTGWQQPQALVDAAMAVVDSYATAVKLGVVVPRRDGHATLVARCTRQHLDEHTCPITVKREAVLPVVTTCVSCLGVVDQDGKVTPPLEPTPAADTRALDQASAEMEPGKRVRTGVRNVPTMTPEEIVAARPADLTPAQLNAYGVLTTGVQTCSTCGVTKPLASFYGDKARLTGKASRCKDCANAATRARRTTKT